MPLFQKLFCIPQRWVVAIMAFFAFFNAYTLRICLSMAITKMAKPLNYTETSLAEACPPYDDDPLTNFTYNTTTKVIYEGSFEWSEYTQGIILSSFYWGYILTHLPGGLLAEKFGPKYTIGCGVLFTAIFTILTPVTTVWGDANALIFLRFLMGLCEGVIQPGVSCLLSKWIPSNERTLATSFVFSGIRFGILISSVMSGLIMSNSGKSWPNIFYLFGGVGILWFVFWVFLCYNSPREHPLIKDEEERYLNECMSEHIHEKAPPFPWKSALKSKAFLAIVIAQSGSDFNSYTIMSDLPKYMQNVLKLPIHLNGYASSVHNVSAWIFCMIMSWVSDWSIEKGYASRTNMRKLNTFVASIGPAIFLVMAMYVGCNVAWAIALIAIGLTFAGSSHPGSKVNVLDLSPNYSGTLLGISNGIGAFMGILAPYAVGVLAPNQTLDEWRLIFWISAVIYFFTTVNYLIFASGDVQDWNDPKRLQEKRSSADVLEDVERLTVNKTKVSTLKKTYM
ncbi:putative inorganic phosphate cotransporter [Phymastichus coffea]|uniref:putative inorganic phosphate cotransporter n=1 Tax=Phymastichus coffea TaxID=108790 RepID=UPI00273C052D|nr:putative inorganic phosphate cotransporter [Phymastichus coffea]